MKINKSLKKVCGEELAKYLALNFNQDKVLENVKKLFNNNGKDVRNISPSEYSVLKNLLNSLQDETKDVEPDTRSATEILKSVGYSLHICPTRESYEKFKKYYREGEVLCKFDDSNRAKNYKLFWLLKDNVEDIKPLGEPTKNDDYSTSCLSIAITNDGRNVAQIVSRYNHTVNGCDNTFNSNLDNIAEGLTDAFNREFGFKLNKNNNQFEFENFCMMDDKYIHYTTEINGVKIGDNTLVADKIINYDHNTHYTYGYYIIDLQTKKILWDEKILGKCEDSFITYFNETVKKIEFIKDIDSVNDTDDTICYIKK